MSMLDSIVADKKKEVALKRSLIPVSQLEASVLFERKAISLAQRLQLKTGIIAEHKRRSPSKAVIRQDCSVQDIVLGYEKAGAQGMSILTDGKYFGGSLDDLLLARASVASPLLRKDFIVEEYQVLEAKAYGADVVLLIAAVLDPGQIKQLSGLSARLGLEVLLEVHDEAELHRSLQPGIQLIGVNNRNLKTFEVTLETSKALSALIPDEFVRVSESGIGNPEAIRELRDHGFQGFLIGEHFMRAEDPGLEAMHFINSL